MIHIGRDTNMMGDLQDQKSGAQEVSIPDQLSILHFYRGTSAATCRKPLEGLVTFVTKPAWQAANMTS